MIDRNLTELWPRKLDKAYKGIRRRTRRKMYEEKEEEEAHRRNIKRTKTRKGRRKRKQSHLVHWTHFCSPLLSSSYFFRLAKVFHPNGSESNWSSPIRWNGCYGRFACDSRLQNRLYLDWLFRCITTGFQVHPEVDIILTWKCQNENHCTLT